MSVQEVKKIIEDTYNQVLPGRFRDPRATVQLLAISGQEADWTARHQIGGPAHGLWQFEKGGGVRGVLTHPASRRYAVAACVIRGVDPSERGAYDAIEKDDLLACAFARLLLFTDAAALPAIGEQSKAWDYYLRNWRPGKPHPDVWPGKYRAALDAVE